jgi:hypothetical protein
MRFEAGQRLKNSIRAVFQLRLFAEQKPGTCPPPQAAFVRFATRLLILEI